MSMDFYKSIYSAQSLKGYVQASVLNIPGIMSQTYKPKIAIQIGKAWKKKTKNGNSYLKVKLDAFEAFSGKAMYGKLWPCKNEAGSFSLRADDADFPAKSLCPLLGSIPAKGTNAPLVEYEVTIRLA